MARCLFTPRFRRLALAVSLWLILSASLVPAASLPTAKPAEVGFSAERLDRLSRIMQEYVDQGKVAGLVALVARKGRVAYLKPFGKLDLERGTPMPANGIFRIASQTKAVTSVAVMILQEEGRILLDDPAEQMVCVFMTQLMPAGNSDLQGKFRAMVYQAIAESYEKR
jgi:CubicO group peptidase (beta-lactamase class C family)